MSICSLKPVLFPFLVAILAQPILCSSSHGQARSEADDKHFVVYRDGGSKDNNGHWTNHMESKLIKDFTQVDETDPLEGKSCTRMTVQFAEPFWCGIAVSVKPNYWGKEPGPGYDLRGARSLVFYARGEKGGETIQVKAAIAGKERFGDSAAAPLETKYISLTREWRKYEWPIDQRKTDLRRVITPFAVFAERAQNRDTSITFYLDNIYYAR